MIKFYQERQAKQKDDFRKFIEALAQKENQAKTMANNILLTEAKPEHQLKRRGSKALELDESCVEEYR